MYNDAFAPSRPVADGRSDFIFDPRGMFLMLRYHQDASHRKPDLISIVSQQEFLYHPPLVNDIS